MRTGGASVAERTDAGWGRSIEPSPRWRTLLDRALLGRSGPAELDYDGRFERPRPPHDDDHTYPPLPAAANGGRTYDGRGVDMPPRSTTAPPPSAPLPPHAPHS